MAKKKQSEKVDGLGPKDIARLRSACRKVWYWSYPRKLVVERCIGKDGFSRCEKCNKRTPKIHVDHIVPVGALEGGFFTRLFCPSTELQGLCKSCHQKKTNEERKKRAIL